MPSKGVATTTKMTITHIKILIGIVQQNNLDVKIADTIGEDCLDKKIIYTKKKINDIIQDTKYNLKKETARKTHLITIGTPNWANEKKQKTKNICFSIDKLATSFQKGIVK